MLTIQEVLQKNPNLLLNRDFLIDLVSTSSHVENIDSLTDDLLYINKIVQVGSKVHVIVNVETKETEEISVPKSRPYMDDKTVLTITNDACPNVKSVLQTTLGNLIANYYLLASVFDDAIPYWNSEWDQKKIADLIVEKFHEGKVTVEQIYKFQDRLNYLPVLSDFFTSSLTEKCISIDPKVKKRRDEIREEIRKNPPSPEQSLIYEDELIALDRASHVGDPAADFLSASKAYGIQRKRLFLGIGLVEPFGDTGADFEYIHTVLDEGWETQDFSQISNDIRRGSYARAKDTAIGGFIMKTLARIFQELKIVSDDCRTKRTIEVVILPDIADAVLSRTIVVSDKYIVLTKDNINQYINKTVKMRSPMMCEAKGGVCGTCVDGYFSQLGIENLNLQPMNIGSVLQNQSMKSLHGIKLQLMNIDSLDTFCV